MKYPILIASILAGCAAQVPPAPPTPPVVVVEKAPPKPAIPDDPYEGLPAPIAAAIRANDPSTIQNGVTTYYPYDADQEYTVNCAPLRVTEIRLGPDENTDKDDVVMGSERWTFTIGDSVVLVKPAGTNQATVIGGPQPMVIPPDPDMSTNMVIHTDKGRVYHLTLRLRRKWMPAVAWFYPDAVRQQEQARETMLKEAAK